MAPKEICTDYDACLNLPHKVTRLVAVAMLTLSDEGWHIVANPPDIVNNNGRYSPDLIALRTPTDINSVNTILVEATNSVHPTKHENKVRQIRVIGAEMNKHRDTVGFIFSGAHKQSQNELQALLLNLSQGKVGRLEFIRTMKRINPQAGNWDTYLKLSSPNEI